MSSIPSYSFVDIHSHVLYGLDDGARTLEDSLAMLEMACSGGTTDIVGTPHSDLMYKFQPEVIQERLAELNAAFASGASAPGPGSDRRLRLHHGCDFHLHFDNIQDCLQNPTRYTINHHRYLLVEFADTQIPKAIDEVLDRMVRLDITPVITHPERNPLLRQQMDEMTKWVRAGCLVQVTAQSFLDRFGKHARQAADDLMERQLVHFVASDAHDIRDRTPLLAEAFAYVTDRYGDVRARALFESNPRATLTGQYLEVEDPVEPKKKRWFW